MPFGTKGPEPGGKGGASTPAQVLKSGAITSHSLFNCVAARSSRCWPASCCFFSAEKGAPASTGSELCGVLANLAMNEEFRGSFAKPFSPRSSSGGDIGGGRVLTVAAVLVLIAGDMTVRSLRVASFCFKRHRSHKSRLVPCASDVDGYDSKGIQNRYDTAVVHLPRMLWINGTVSIAPQLKMYESEDA